LRSLRASVFSFLAASYIRLVGGTSRILWVNRAIRDQLEATKNGFIYAFWHGRQAFLVYLHRGDHLYTMISRSRDGEIIARVCQAFRLGAVRGSSSRHGREAFLEMKRLVDTGNRVAFTPDGPRGPLREVHQGVLVMARATGRPIVPVAYGARRRWVFKGSWDEYVVPKPFNRIVMVYGAPVHVGPSDDLTLKASELKSALDEVSHRADAVAGVRP
jgi:lysophospholipid acyltransferase (LPLAT)-like uncharacterized protein